MYDFIISYVAFNGCNQLLGEIVMNRFEKPNFKKKMMDSINFSLPIFFAVLFLFLFGLSFISQTSETEQKNNLERALNRSIVNCYAVEGAYPSSLAYIEENYGITYDKDKFFVDYQVLGSNLMPDITIIERTHL